MEMNGPEKRLYNNIWRCQIRCGEDKPTVLRLIAGADQSPGREWLLDIVCGDGTLAVLMKEKCREVHGVEFSDDAITRASKP